MTEPQVARRPARFARFARQTRAHLHNKNYIRADRLDKWVTIIIGIAVLIVVALDSTWLMGWLK